MDGRLRVLVLGGYGTFGSRLAELLSDEPRITLVIAGRSKAKAEALAPAYPPAHARNRPSWIASRSFPRD